MRVQLLIGGGIEIVPNKETIRLIKSLRRVKPCLSYSTIEGAILNHFLRPNYEITSPASVGALTSATLITDGIDVWGDMQYQVQSMIDTLLDGKPVTLQKG